MYNKKKNSSLKINLKKIPLTGLALCHWVKCICEKYRPMSACAEMGRNFSTSLYFLHVK